MGAGETERGTYESDEGREMKKLLLSLMLVCGAVNAAEYWTAPTKEGGEIVLSKDRTTKCGDVLYSMYIVTVGQKVISGCWTVMEGRVHVRYDDGDRMAYDLNIWTQKGTP